MAEELYSLPAVNASDKYTAHSHLSFMPSNPVTEHSSGDIRTLRCIEIMPASNGLFEHVFAPVTEEAIWQVDVRQITTLAKACQGMHSQLDACMSSSCCRHYVVPLFRVPGNWEKQANVISHLHELIP